MKKLRSVLGLVASAALIFTASPAMVPAEAAPTALLPLGPPGPWDLVWHDEFSGASHTAPNATKWTRPVWRVQNVTTDPANAWIYDGKLVLNLSSRTKGALVRSRFQFMPGMVVEFRARFVGNYIDPIWNWPGVWAAGIKYPDSGEHDIAEGLPPGLKVSYWDEDRTLRYSKLPPGKWYGGYHTFTLYRGETAASVWWDGGFVGSYATNDDGGPEALLASLGSTPGVSAHLGKGSRMRVDYVRVWAPAS